MTDDQRIAILLRGRQCTGKTEVGILLAGKKPISLDDGNYDQLRASKDVLVIELGYGEAPGKPPGPTCDPGKWQRVLAEENRALHAFFLTADRVVREARAAQSGRRGVGVPSLNASDQIHSWPEVVQFAKRAGIFEHEIDTSLKSLPQVADEIREIVKRVHPGVRWPSTQS
jgi:hypothetical protein